MHSRLAAGMMTNNAAHCDETSVAIAAGCHIWSGPQGPNFRVAVMERFFLQVATVFSALVLLGLGISGVMLGVQFMHGVGTITVDNYFRLVSGMMMGMGLVLLFSVPHVERYRERFGILTFMIVLGGLAELYSVLLHGIPSVGTLFGIFMTLIYAPLLWLLQRHVARHAALHPH